MKNNMTFEKSKRNGWSEKFKKYSEEGEDPILLPDYLDSKAINLLDKESPVILGQMTCPNCGIQRGTDMSKCICGYNPMTGRVEQHNFSEAIKGDLDIPSKDQRDWNKWDKENNHKTPKTWSEYLNHPNCEITSTISLSLDGKDYLANDNSIEKSALALLKIHQLIEFGYGGNVKNRDKINFFVIQWSYQDKRFVIRNFGPFLEDCGTIACFHTKEQAIEFLSYPENVHLLKDYYMI